MTCNARSYAGNSPLATGLLHSFGLSSDNAGLEGRVLLRFFRPRVSVEGGASAVGALAGAGLESEALTADVAGAAVEFARTRLRATVGLTLRRASMMKAAGDARDEVLDERKSQEAA